MKTGKSLTELARTLESNRDKKVDLVADTRDITMRPVPTATDVVEPILSMNGEQFMPTQHCHHQVAAFTGIGTRYYDKMLADSPALLAGNVNHWFQKDDGKVVQVLPE